MNIFLKFEGKTTVINEIQLRQLLLQNQQSLSQFYFISQSKNCTHSSKFYNNQNVYVYSRLLGGKGGFGAKLKTEGGKKVRPNQNMFSRDLQGQPIAYATITREYQDYYRKKTIQNQKVKKQIEQFKVISHTYREDYASNKLDSTYNAEMQQNQKRLQDAMKVGIKKYLQKKKEAVQAVKKQDSQANKIQNQQQINQDQKPSQIWKDCQQKQNQSQDEDQFQNNYQTVQPKIQKKQQQKEEKNIQEQEKEQIPIKRPRPIQKQSQKIQQKLPTKQIKQNPISIENKKNQHLKSGILLNKASDKLKSIFKR